MKVLKDKSIDQLHLICNKGDKETYEALQKVAPGSYFELNPAARLGFAGLLPVLSREIARLSIAKGPDSPLAMAPPPLPPIKDAPKLPEIAVPAAPASEAAPTPPKVDLAPSPPPDAVKNPRIPPAPPSPPVARVQSPPRAETPALKTVQSTEMFSEHDSMRLIIAIAAWTAVIAAAIGLLLLAGQKLYLQKSLPGLGDISKAVAAGLIAGLAGGALSQWFFQNTSGGAAMDLLTRSAAWALLGGLLGAGIGIFVPNLKWHRGLLG